MNRNPTQLFPLDSSGGEAIFAPFQDPMISRSLKLELKPLAASHCNLSPFWCWLTIRWEGCPAGQDAAQLTVPCDIELGRFDQLIACLNLPAHVSVRFAARVNGAWRCLGGATRGEGHRIEITPKLPRGRMTGVRATFRSHTNTPTTLQLSWFGLADSKLTRRIETGKLKWNPDWPDLIQPAKEIKFARGLLFDASDLPGFRAKKKLPGWREHFAVLETRAQRYLKREPEADLGEFLPFSDIRYLRAREQGKEPFFWEALIVGFVGLVNEDERMMRHALRYLMCMAHTTHWCQSAESRLKGSTWDQRCFVEEMATTSCALLLDWFDFALTDRARDLVRQAIWDKGLAIIERDMMKFEYVYHINQGPWFCRARVLGGLMLEGHWPRVGRYVERALADLREGLDHYVLADGGTDEGVGYWAVTFQAALPALIAFGRARGVDPRNLLPRQVARCERFLATMSAVQPGRVLLDGDNTNDHLLGDAVAMMAGLYPKSVYEEILGACLLKERPFTYLHHYLAEGMMAFALGPNRIARPRCIVPAFSLLNQVGQLTSYRTSPHPALSRKGRGKGGGHPSASHISSPLGGEDKGEGARSIRIHLTGAKANASHTHLDKGAFTLELDGAPFLVDRGTVRYDDWRSEILHRTYLHNAITPCRNDGTFPDQANVTQPVIPTGNGDAKRLRAAIDLSHVWREWMHRCRRVVRAESFEEFVIEDTGELNADGRVAFHLHSPWPFVVPPSGGIRTSPPESGTTNVTLTHAGIALEIIADWAESATQRVELIDYKFEPVHHLVLLSRPLKQFSLKTRFRRM